MDTGEAPPQRPAYYRTSPKIIQVQEKRIFKYARNNIIEPSTLLHQSKNKSGEYRFTVDHRCLIKVKKVKLCVCEGQ